MFSCKYWNILRQLYILKIIREQLLLKVKLNLFKVSNLSSVWLKFRSCLNGCFWRCNIFKHSSNEVVHCKFAGELYFWAITLWTWVIVSYVLIVILFVQQNILILFIRNRGVTKTSHIWNNLLIFFFCILIIDIFHFSRCSLYTKYQYFHLPFYLNHQTYS